MISIWTRTLTVKKTGKCWITAFSDFVDRPESSDECTYMDDCQIVAVEYTGGNIKDQIRELAEMLRDAFGYSGYLYGGQKEHPSGHRRFVMKDTRKNEKA